MADALGLRDLNPGDRDLWLIEQGRDHAELDLDGVDFPFRINRHGATMLRDWLDAFLGGGNAAQASLMAPPPEEPAGDAERPQEGETELDDLDGPHRPQFVAGSDTSREAALKAYPGFGTRKRAIVHALAERAEEGATRDELAKILDVSPNTIRPRVAELIAGGWVKVATSVTGGSMTRRTETGHEAEVLVLTAAAVEQVNRGE